MTGLTIIGERINPGFKSSKALFDQRDIEGIQRLAVEQVEKGASLLNVNIGTIALEEPSFMIKVIRAIQDVVSVPLSFDFPRKEIQELCLGTYDREKSGNSLPLMNSISELRWEMLDLYGSYPFRPILMASERVEDGERIANKTGREVYDTALRMVRRIKNSSFDIPMDHIFVDVSVTPLSVDMEGLTRMAIESIELIGSDPELKGINMTVGLSNLSIMLPSRASDGTLLKSQVESSFLSMTVPKGLNHIIGTAGRDYRFLEEDNFVFSKFRQAVGSEGMDSLMAVQEMYQ